MGADGVELDVRPSADGHLVVHHDAELGDGRRISRLTWREIPARVPFLEPVLDACGNMIVDIEIKTERDDPDFDPEQTLARILVELLAGHEMGSRVLVSSFDISMIASVRALSSEIPTALVTRHSAEAINRAVDGGHVAINPSDAVVDEHYVAAAHDAGLAVNVWTVDDPERIRQLAEFGVDAVITNVPEIAIAVLGSRGC